MIDLINKKFGKLLVLKKHNKKGNKGQIKWECKCDCGNSHIVTGESLREGKSKSCGCLKKGRPQNFQENRELALWKNLFCSTVMKKARKNGYITDVSLEDFMRISKQPCYYCGSIGVQKTNDYDSKSKKLITNTIIRFNGIDRVDNNKTYLLSNIVSCCKHCNTAKNTLTINEFKKLIIKIYNNFARNSAGVLSG